MTQKDSMIFNVVYISEVLNAHRLMILLNGDRWVNPVYAHPGLDEDHSWGSCWPLQAVANPRPRSATDNGMCAL